jgi:hypothetical protein
VSLEEEQKKKLQWQKKGYENNTVESLVTLF